MWRIGMGGASRYCDGISRRSFVQLGAAGMATAGLPEILRAKNKSAEQGRPSKNTSVIMVWLDGGPGHMDLYDLKPEAPAEYRGIWQPIPTNVPGFEISQLFPLQAKVADKFSIVRSLHHDTGDHFTGAHYMLTGRDGANGGDTTGKSPSIGSIATRVLGPRKPGMPAYVAVPYAASIGIRPGYFAANYLGKEFDPFETDGDPNAENFQVQNMNLAGGLTVNRLEDRRGLMEHFDRTRRFVDQTGMADSMDRFQVQAFDMVTGTAAREAFNLSGEDAALRDRYGRNTWGQSTLLARRLVEAGATMVTVHLGGWDHHLALKTGMENYLPKVDQALYGLFSDLSERGLSDQVLVVVCGEFSRTPRMNNGGNGGPAGSMGTPGRDHWGSAMFCVLGGGGLQGGQIVGATNRLGEYPLSRPITCSDIHATIYHVLGVDPSVSFLNHAGRPVPAIDHGEVIAELV